MVIALFFLLLVRVPQERGPSAWEIERGHQEIWDAESSESIEDFAKRTLIERQMRIDRLKLCPRDYGIFEPNERFGCVTRI